MQISSLDETLEYLATEEIIKMYVDARKNNNAKKSVFNAEDTWRMFRRRNMVTY